MNISPNSETVIEKGNILLVITIIKNDINLFEN